MGAPLYNASLTGGCPAPLYNSTQWPTTGGYTDGRLCLPSVPCCLPCPNSQWIFPEDDFVASVTGAAWLGVVSAILLVFLLISYLALPVQYTNSHYLNTCMLISTIFLNLGFIVPLGTGIAGVGPNVCANPITPADMYTSTSCAFSGAFILAGGISATTWVMIRSLSMHLQICWEVTPGRKFFYWAQGLGWGFPAAIFTAALSATGVSARWGNGACFPNHPHAKATFFGWLLAACGVCTAIQLATMGYCLHVYLRNLWSDDDDVDTELSGQNGNEQSYQESSQRGRTARAIYNRLKQVLWLQWRALTMVTLILVNVVYASIVFVYLDAHTYLSEENIVRATPFVACLLANPIDHHMCYDDASNWIFPLPISRAVFVLLQMIGIIVFALFFRFSILIGWKELIRSWFGGPGFITLESRAGNKRDQWDDPSHQKQVGKGGMIEMTNGPRSSSGGDGYHDQARTDEGSDSPGNSTIGSPMAEKTQAAAQYSSYAQQQQQHPQQQYQHTPQPQYQQAQQQQTAYYNNPAPQPPSQHAPQHNPRASPQPQFQQAAPQSPQTPQMTSNWGTALAPTPYGGYVLQQQAPPQQPVHQQQPQQQHYPLANGVTDGYAHPHSQPSSPYVQRAPSELSVGNQQPGAGGGGSTVGIAVPYEEPTAHVVYR